jgi:hypothetical protein
MAQQHELRSFDYVNHPYAQVAAALRARADEIFARATAAATSRAQSLATTLRFEIAGVEIGKQISIDVVNVGEIENDPSGSPMLRMKLTWRATRNPTLFPSMEANLDVYPLSSEETQLDLHGFYVAPLGVLGGALDAIAGHRVAEASVRRFVEDVARYLREDLGRRRPSVEAGTSPAS